MKKFLTICAVVFITAGNMWADTHYVDPEGSNTHPYTTPATAAHSIQDAINAAISGDFINVVNGTYVLSSTINVDKSLTLTGESEAGVQIDASGNGTGYGIKIEADNVTMQYFTILPPIVSGSVGTSGGGGYAIHASFNHTAPYSKYNNLALDHITVNNGNRTAFDIHGYHGVTLDDLTATGAAYGNGISLTGCSNGVVTNCTTSSNAWGGIAVYVSKPAYLGTGSDNITIDFSTNTIGEWIYVEDEYSLVNTNINILTWTYAINNDYSATANYTAYINTTLADALFFGAVLNLKFLNMQSVVYDLAGDTYYVGPGMSIQRAIDVASAGDDIIVAAGTYAGFIVATANIELRGAQYNNDPAGATTRGAAGDGDESVITGTITITADNVTVNGFKTGYPINVGYDHAHYVNISYNISENANGQYGAIHLHGPPYNQCDWAYIGFNTISGTTSPDWQGGGIWTVGNDDIIIEHNHILNSQYMGIFAPNHVGNRNIIRYNTITNSGHTPIRFWGGSQADISYNVIDGGGMDGIWVDQAADNSTVSYNQISNVTYATVTLRGGATGVNVLHNTITTSEKGVEIRGSGNTICNNQIFNTTYEGIQAFASATITGNEVYGCYHGVQLRGNATSYTVTLNNIHDNTYNGIEIPNYSGEVVSSATIEDNILADNSCCGVKVGGNTDGSGYHINSNGITGNGIYGVESLTTADVDAEENYWGDASGSSGAGPGAGDAVSPNVDFCYWLDAASGGNPVYPGDAGENVTIYYGYPPADPQLNASGGLSYSWSPTDGLSDPNIANPTVSFYGILTDYPKDYTVTVVDAYGCVGTDEVTVTVIDVRCGKKMDKVLVCKVPPGNPGNAHTVCVSPNAVPALLEQGSYLGECENGKSSIIYEEENDPETIDVNAYPNPFKEACTIEVSITELTNAKIQVIDLLGRNVGDIFEGSLDAGVHTFTWDNVNIGETNSIYFLQVFTDKETKIMKLMTRQ